MESIFWYPVITRTLPVCICLVVCSSCVLKWIFTLAISLLVAFLHKYTPVIQYISSASSTDCSRFFPIFMCHPPISVLEPVYNLIAVTHYICFLPLESGILEKAVHNHIFFQFGWVWFLSIIKFIPNFWVIFPLNLKLQYAGYYYGFIVSILAMWHNLQYQYFYNILPIIYYLPRNQLLSPFLILLCKHIFWYHILCIIINHYIIELNNVLSVVN